MASGKELRTKIKSVENTKKITKAMEMISVSKMRKAQERMRAIAFSEKGSLYRRQFGEANPEYVHAFMKTKRRQGRWDDCGVHGQGLCAVASIPTCFGPSPAKLRDAQSAGKSAITVAIGSRGQGFSEPHWRQGGIAGYPSGRQTTSIN